mgnify:CR=1 FL=1
MPKGDDVAVRVANDKLLVVVFILDGQTILDVWPAFDGLRMEGVGIFYPGIGAPGSALCAVDDNLVIFHSLTQHADEAIAARHGKHGQITPEFWVVEPELFAVVADRGEEVTDETMRSCTYALTNHWTTLCLVLLMAVPSAKIVEFRENSIPYRISIIAWK